MSDNIDVCRVRNGAFLLLPFPIPPGIRAINSYVFFQSITADCCWTGLQFYRSTEVHVAFCCPVTIFASVLGIFDYVLISLRMGKMPALTHEVTQMVFMVFFGALEIVILFLICHFGLPNFHYQSRYLSFIYQVWPCPSPAFYQQSGF